jgi:hypothetical protein
MMTSADPATTPKSEALSMDPVSSWHEDSEGRVVQFHRTPSHRNQYRPPRRRT